MRFFISHRLGIDVHSGKWLDVCFSPHSQLALSDIPHLFKFSLALSFCVCRLKVFHIFLGRLYHGGRVSVGTPHPVSASPLVRSFHSLIRLTIGFFFFSNDVLFLKYFILRMIQCKNKTRKIITKNTILRAWRTAAMDVSDGSTTDFVVDVVGGWHTTRRIRRPSVRTGWPRRVRKIDGGRCETKRDAIGSDTWEIDDPRGRRQGAHWDARDTVHRRKIRVGKTALPRWCILLRSSVSCAIWWAKI